MRAQRLSGRFVLVYLLVSLASCDRSVPVVVAGVSLELAQHRARTISEVHYRLRFDIPAVVDADIEGFVAISFVLEGDGSELQLDFRETSDRIHSVLSNGKTSTYRFENEHIVIPESELSVGANEIVIEFTAGSSSLNRNSEYLYTLFVPDRARTAFPLFDQPDLKATYDLTLVVPAGWSALSNASITSVNHEGNRIEYSFRQSDLISSYLFSFVTGKFESVTQERNGRSMTLLHRETDKDKVQRNVDSIFQLHAAAIDWLEAYTGIDYPYQKFGFVLIPAFQYGGMEHVGAIQYRASSLFLDEAPSDTELLGRASLIAHETAHMWFGNLVTMKWFNDVWTKEVFANFMAAKIVNPAFPAINHDLNFLVRHYPRAYSVDRTDGANSVRQQLANLNEAGQLYGAIIYNKAPIMMRQLESLLGEELFREGLQEYLQRYAWTNATWPDLIRILDARSDQDLEAWSGVWVDTAGRPEFKEAWETVADGRGYGLFPASIKILDDWNRLGEVEKGTELINLFENLLAGSGPAVQTYFLALQKIVAAEQNQLLLNLALGQLSTIYWKFLPVSSRQEYAQELERILWQSMLVQTESSKKKIYFKVFADIALSTPQVQKIHDVWSGALEIEDLRLSENDRIDLAQLLAIKLPQRAAEIIALQIENTQNPDSKRKLEFLAPSLSADGAERDRFFHSLAEEGNRHVESWVLDALRNLHHPLRTGDSEQYLLPSLELLQEIQVTGDIFFPKQWLDVTFENYRSSIAVHTVKSFLEQRPDYNEQLRMKILQSTDTLFRANVISLADEAGE